MPIISHTLASTTWPEGTTSNVVRLYDQDGTEYTQSFFAPVGFNIQTKIDSMIAEMSEQLAQTEFETLVGT